MRSPSHISSPPLIIITHPSPPPPPPSFFPSHFPRCLVTLAPVILPLPSFTVEERKGEGERERLQPTTTMSPEAPLLACPSCCSVQLWLSTRPWPAGILTLPESHEKSHCVWELLASLAASSLREPSRHWLHLQLPNLSAWAWLWQLGPRHLPCPWCSPCSAWHQHPSWEAAHWLAGVPSPYCSAWSPMVSPASRCWHHKRARTWRRCEYDEH